MKTKFLLMICLFFCFCKGWAQETTKVFPTSDAIWVIHNHYDYERYIYGLSGDTAINDNTYHKLYLLNDTTLNIGAEDIYVAGIRIQDEYVLMKPADKTNGYVFEEFILYDFNEANNGKTINLGKRPLIYDDYHTSSWGPTFDNIDQGYLDGYLKDQTAYISHYNKFVFINYNYGTDEWVKGIGSLSGLFFSRPPTTTCYCQPPNPYYLICMKEKNEVKYLREKCSSCFNYDPNVLSIENTNSENDDISIRHNRINRTIDIIVGNGLYSTVSFQLTNLKGETFLFDKINTNTSINLYNIPPGFYIYKIAGEESSKKGKILIP